jgi:predicted lysophospholipase L1 biosynthesis ABC-type transport system permease subunit
VSRVSRRDADREDDDALDRVEPTIDALLALAVVVALVGVVNAQVLSTVERAREIGVLRAVGASRARVRAAVPSETLIVGLLDTVLALALGVPLALLLVEAQRPALPTVVPVPGGRRAWRRSRSLRRSWPRSSRRGGRPAAARPARARASDPAGR